MEDKVLIINKPKGITSHDVVDIVRRKLGVRKVGHAGTLDPTATGVLIVLVGKKTKEQIKYMQMEKEYVAEVEFGIETDTGDAEGKITEQIPPQAFKNTTRSQVEIKCLGFLGKIRQSVPLYSAVKIKGKKLYELARKGIKPKKLPERIIEIKKIEILDFKKGTDKTYPVVKLKATCGKGVYIRQLAVDLGKALGFPAHLKSLVRTRIGEFSLDQAQNLTNSIQ
ncbi:tRNA pseudouridine(55) synthase TruB [Candidatus Microgenomates bacterium]|nr:tRNA pseudouridine(55) synthase TruB [Candidatus Microgenomates bacterium]